MALCSEHRDPVQDTAGGKVLEPRQGPHRWEMPGPSGRGTGSSALIHILLSPPRAWN